MFRWFSLIAGVVMAATSAEARISCGDVYANSVRNISVEARLAIEKDNLFNKHCSTSGEINKSSSGFDFSGTVKEYFDVGFSGSQSEARQQMEAFCKEHRQTRDTQNELFKFDNTVVVDALNSLNQCRALEINETYISHALVEPRAVIVTVEFNPDKANLRFRGITYDPDVAECRTTGLSAKGEAINIDSATKEMAVDKPFSVICERKGAPTKDGATKFPRFVVGLDTNYGPYTVVMPLEELAGFDLGSEYKRNVLALTGEVQQLQADKSALTGSVTALEQRIANASAEMRLVRQGEKPAGGYWEHVTCPDWGGDLDKHVQNVCGTRKPQIRHLHTHGGNHCGYGYYVYACLKTD